MARDLSGGLAEAFDRYKGGEDSAEEHAEETPGKQDTGKGGGVHSIHTIVHKDGKHSVHAFKHDGTVESSMHDSAEDAHMKHGEHLGMRGK